MKTNTKAAPRLCADDQPVPPNDQPQYLTSAQAAKLFPSRPSSCSVWRWMRHGIKAADGTRIKLACVRSGRGMYTWSSAVHEFMVELAKADDAHFEKRHAEREIAAVQAKRDTKGKRSPKARAKAVNAAKARLAARGV